MSAQSEDTEALYQAKVAAGEIEPDAAQSRAARSLSALQSELDNRRFATKSNSLGWLFARHETANPIKGLYIHGAVGRGKTMLMDLFFDAAPDLPKRRLHFHEFMAETHERIRAWRARAQAGEVSGEDPIAPVAASTGRKLSPQRSKIRR